MNAVETERLWIIPLDIRDLETCIERFDEMEKSLNFQVTFTMLSERQKNVFRLRLARAKENPSEYLWNTIWLIALKAENRMVGSIMIKGCPNGTGEITIGYSTEQQYKNRGFMTEALSGLSEWVFLNPNVISITADTLKTNYASHRVLQKVGMIKYKEDDECFWWKLKNRKNRLCNYEAKKLFT